MPTEEFAPIPNTLPDAFGMELTYGVGETVTGVPLRRDGRVAEVVWQSRGRRPQAYGYRYDAHGHLRSAAHADYQAAGWHLGNRYKTQYTCDADGRLATLERWGPRTVADGATPCFERMDYFRYAYTYGRLATVRNLGFNTSVRARGTHPMTYSPVGELTHDHGAGTTIAYDAFSRPQRVTLGNGARVELGYTATGEKYYQREVSAEGTTSETQYHGAIEMRDGSRYAVMHPHGRALLNEDGDYDHDEYVLRDHLGSTRVVLRDRYFDVRDVTQLAEVSADDEPIVATWRPVLRILQVNDYYPFGQSLEVQVPGSQRGRDYRYTYTG